MEGSVGGEAQAAEFIKEVANLKKEVKRLSKLKK
jgi:hypothetical protein